MDLDTSGELEYGEFVASAQSLGEASWLVGWVVGWLGGGWFGQLAVGFVGAARVRIG